MTEEELCAKCGGAGEVEHFTDRGKDLVTNKIPCPAYCGAFERTRQRTALIEQATPSINLAVSAMEKLFGKSRAQ